MSQKLAVNRQVDATQSLVRAAADAATSLQESTNTLVNSQTDVARAAADAVRQIAEVKYCRHLDWLNLRIYAALMSVVFLLILTVMDSKRSNQSIFILVPKMNRDSL